MRPIKVVVRGDSKVAAGKTTVTVDRAKERAMPMMTAMAVKAEAATKDKTTISVRQAAVSTVEMTEETIDEMTVATMATTSNSLAAPTTSLLAGDLKVEAETSTMMAF